VWIPTVFNLSWPSHQSLDSASQRAELLRLLDTAKRLGLKAVFLQVRPEGDALYRSSLEPWSRFLTGTQGRDPGYDPLQFAIEAAQVRGLEVHAWINPFRACASERTSRDPRHLSRRLNRYAYWVEGTLYMDPGIQAVQDHVVRVAREIVRNYAVTGLHLDDYFYPYPKTAGVRVSFPDAATYAAYVRAGGKLGREDWRRQNVNQLIARLSQAVKEERPGTQFSVSPFGIYRPGLPSGIHAQLDQYSQLYSDPVKWMKEGWVDFLVPQLYWPDKSDQSFSKLLAWWRSPQANPRGIPIYPGLAIERLHPPHNWPTREIQQQLALSRHATGGKPGGYVLFSATQLEQDVKSVQRVIRSANGM
jgi:uncharacterized lipoprotein YddW (UPF0748 family)